MPEKFKLHKHLYLIGPRGAGKSSLGRRLAKRLTAPFYDLDELIQSEQGRSIAHIVQAQGWPAFRDMESRALAQLAGGLPPAIIATGGGVVLNDANAKIMRDSGIVVYLQAPLEVLQKRLERAAPTAHRPALTALPPGQEMAQIIREREPLYLAAAMLTVDASLPKARVAGAIVRALAKFNV